MRMTRSVGWFFLFMFIVTGANTGRAEETAAGNGSLAAYLPDGAIGTLETAKLAPLIERIETSGALQMVLDSPQWREALKQDQVQKGLAGKAIAEGQLGMSLWQFAKTYLGDRMILGVYPPLQPGSPPEGVIIVRVNEAASLSKLWDRLTSLIPLAGNKLKIGDYAGGGRLITVDDGGQIVVRDRWIVMSKVKSLLDQTLQNLANPSETKVGLLESAAWKEMGTQLGTDHHVQLCVNVPGITQLVGHRLPSKLDNPVVSLLFGGYMELAAGSPYLGSTLDVYENHFELKSTVSGDPKQLDAAHRPFVLEREPVPRADVPSLKTPLNGFSLTRDFSKWYRNREALLDASLLPNFDKFETGLATFLPGRDLGEEVLPLLGQRLTIVTSPQNYTNLKGKPGVQLPGFALLLDLTKPAEASDVLNLVFQSVILISNFQAAQEGRQPFVLSSESYHETQIAYAKYVKTPDGATLPISYNFQPASARVGNRYVFATSLELCRELVDTLKAEASATPIASDALGGAVRDLFLELSPAVGADLLESNQQILIAQNLQQGKSADQSAQELAALFKILRQLTPVTFSSTRHADRWVFELRGGWK